MHPEYEILSFGHGTLESDRIIELLRGEDVTVLADVRTHPGSRRCPQVNQEKMIHWLAGSGISYWWIPELGGRRGATPGCERDVYWRHPSFRNYAGHTRTDEFSEGITKLMVLARRTRVAYMCSESVWWKCHRRIISDYLVKSMGIRVGHLMHDGSVVDHHPPSELRCLPGGKIVYDGGQLPLSLHGH